MTADKTNAARTRQHNKKHEKNLVCEDFRSYSILDAIAFINRKNFDRDDYVGF